jgi:nucleoside-diphosphate-sugar epimerase
MTNAGSMSQERPSARLAVTGAGGFIARHLIPSAAAAQWDVVGIVRSRGAAASVRAAGGRPISVPGLERCALARAFDGAGVVVHLAQIGAERAGDLYEGVNVEGTHAVIGAARDAGVERIVYFSGLGVARYGMSPRCTNAYFLSKLAAELALFRSGLPVVVFRPSYVVGTGSGLIVDLRRQILAGEVERVGDGRYRMQPVAVADAADAIVAGARRPAAGHAVVDLVGPEPVSYRELLDRLARCVSPGRTFRVREVAVAEAERQAAAGGYRGMLPDELDCLLCDEVGDARPLAALLGRALAPLDAALAAAVTG